MKAAKPITVKDAKEVGALMRKIRKNRNVPQNAVARKMKVSVSSLSRMESGLKIPQLNNFIKFCNAIDVEIILQQK